MNIRVSSNDYMLKILSTYKLYADTNIFLQNSWEKAKEFLFTRLAQCNRKLIVLGSVMAELRKLANATDKLAVACRAQKAINTQRKILFFIESKSVIYLLIRITSDRFKSTLLIIQDSRHRRYPDYLRLRSDISLHVVKTLCVHIQDLH